MANISPGVYAKIIDLSSYVSAVPGTIGFICGLTEKGRDNELRFVGSRSELISEWGEPNINTYGAVYGQGLYEAYNYLGESGSLYFLRCLPDDATYSNLRINASIGACDSSALITIDYVDSVNDSADITTALVTNGNTRRLCLIYPIGRGQYYNSLGIRITSHANPLLNGIYVFDVYEKQTDGTDAIIESFDISFDPTAKDDAGASLYIEDVLETYSSVLRASIGTDGYELVAKTYDKDIGTNVSVNLTAGSATLTDDKQDFGDWEKESGCADYVIVAKDGKGNEIWGWMGAASGNDDDTIAVYDYRDLDATSVATVQQWNGDTADFDVDSNITYQVKQSNVSVASAFISSTPRPLKKGSDGALLDEAGDLVASEATEVLANGYAGTIDTDVLDTDNIYFTLVFDAGYPTSVKNQIVTLAQTRKDCVAICDNNDNASYSASITSRVNNQTYNTYYAALYESFNKVYDIFTGKDIWFSPIYHMSYLLPKNDAVSELWYAVGGFKRASINTAKELRFNPRLGQRDQMYLRQINPIVKFTAGYVVWGQLTTQSKASALQDLNIVRLVLYCKRALSQYSQNFIFDQNDQVTWGGVANDVSEFLESVKKKRGLYSYNIDVSATKYEKKTKTFHVNVTLEPTRAVEKIELNFFIK